MIRRILLLTGIVTVGLLFADAVTYTYDDAGRLTAVNYPNGTSITYTYDAAGNLTGRMVTGASSSAKKPAPKSKTETEKEKAKTESNK